MFTADPQTPPSPASAPAGRPGLGIEAIDALGRRHTLTLDHPNRLFLVAAAPRARLLFRKSAASRTAAVPASDAEPRAALQIRLFGTPCVRYRGRPIFVAGRSRVVEVLAYLLLHRGTPVVRKRLAFALWPDEPAEAALANARRHLHALARVLPPAPGGGRWFTADAKTVQWNGEAGETWCDVAAFEDHLRAGRLATAVDLYTADLVEDCDSEWIVSHRERLSEMHVEALRRLGELYATRREFPRAIACAKRILALDPWREDTLRMLVRLRCESGDRAGALTEYLRFAERLRSELGAEPMRETVAACSALIGERRAAEPV